MANVDQIIEDLIEGATKTNPHVRVEMVKKEGHEVKLASNYGGLGGAFLGPPGAALGAEEGSGWRAAGGSTLGGLGGIALGGGLGALTDNPELAWLLAGLGGSVGSGIGGHYGGKEKTLNERVFGRKLGSLDDAYNQGVAAAKARFKVT